MNPFKRSLSLRILKDGEFFSKKSKHRMGGTRILGISNQREKKIITV